jgi:hypothetical protein
MNTSKNNKADLKSKDPLDKLIFERGLRIKNVIIDKELDLIGIILNTGKILETKISIYPRLKNSTEKELQKWELIGEGVGISWEDLNEDLSVKGFIQTVAISDMLEHLEASVNTTKASA